jgi:prevent-host-death family protein
MRKASIRDLHIRTSELVRDAADGEIIVIERRGEPVAELRPLTPKLAPTREDMEAMVREIEAFWEGKPVLPDSTPLIEEDRNR